MGVHAGAELRAVAERLADAWANPLSLRSYSAEQVRQDSRSLKCMAPKHGWVFRVIGEWGFCGSVMRQPWH